MPNFIDNSKNLMNNVSSKINNLEASIAVLKEQATKKLIEESENRKTAKHNLINQFRTSYSDFVKQIKEVIIDDPAVLISEENNSSFNKKIQFVSETEPSLQDVLAQAEERMSLDNILVGLQSESFTSQDEYYYPVYLPWQNPDFNTPQHLHFSFDQESRIEVVNLVNSILVRMLMAFPPGSVEFTFIDPLRSHDSSFIVNNLENVEANQIYGGKIISSEEDIRQRLNDLSETVGVIQRTFIASESAVSRYQADGKILHPYQVVLIYDLDNIHSVNDSLASLIENGARFGVYLVIVQKKIDDKDSMSSAKRILSSNRLISITQESNHFSFTTPSGERRKFRTLYSLSEGQSRSIIDVFGDGKSKFITEYFKKYKKILIQNKEKNKVLFDYSKLENTFKDGTDNFAVPVGIARNKEFLFQIDQESNVHTFILGRTGSGKSVLLNDILTSSVVHYGPDTLQLYLMDFKEGGLELAVYQDTPHVRALLIDNTDRQVVQEILSNLRAEMERRGNLLREKGIRSIADYNKTATEKLPRIILAIDECHLLFPRRRDKMQESIDEDMEYFATQGRNQGINLILATQTLADSNIPEQIMKNITNKFVLRADPSDADRLIQHNAGLLNQLTQPGQAITHRKGERGDDYLVLQPYYNQDKRLKEILSKNTEKTQRYIQEHNLKLSPTAAFSGTYEPTLESIPETQNYSAIVGKVIGMNADEYAALAIHKREGGMNLLIAGSNESNFGDSTLNAMRVFLSSLITLTDYYKTRKAKNPHKIYIIDRQEPNPLYTKFLESFVANPENNCEILSNRDDIEDKLGKLYTQIQNKEESKEDVYLCILKQQSYRELRNMEKIKIEVESDPSEASADDYFTKYGEVPSSDKGLTYQKVLKDIFNYGPDYGIHSIVQVDKFSNLLFDDYGTVYRYFRYVALLSMPNSDAQRITKDQDLNTEGLATTQKRARAYLFDDSSNKVSLFTPFAFPKI